MTQPPRRKPASSRTTASRPRKIAGRTSSPAEPGPAPGPPAYDDEAASEEGIEETDPAWLVAVEGGHDGEDDATAQSAADATERPADDGGRLASERLTTVLLGVLALVLVAGLALSGTLIYDQVTAADASEAAEVPEGQIAVPEGRPVIIDELAWQEGVDAAAEAAKQIVSVNYENYGSEVDDAAGLMTDEFAATYRQTAEDVRQEIIDRKTVVQATVAAQGVVRANQTELQALIFLNQFVKREDKDGPTNVITPYKVLVTMVHTDDGWFVESLDTDDRSPVTGDQPAVPEGTEGSGQSTGPTQAPSPTPSE